MKQLPISNCDCCGLSVNPWITDNCPRCNYPTNQNREELFLKTSINDLQRVSKYGGGNLQVDELIHRYQLRLNAVHQLKTLSSNAVTPISSEAKTFVGPSIAKLSLPEVKVTPISIPSQQLEQEQSFSVSQTNPQPPRRVFSWREFFADQAINIVASIGAFLLLIGSLSFTTTTSNLFISFLVVFVVHAVFGITGFFSYRFKTFRIVASIYTIIFALLIPLVGYSAFRLLSGSHIEFSIPVLIAISATYAAIIYTLMAIYQRFIPFAYLGMVALLVADLAMADALNLAYWWWPSMAMLLSIAATISLKRPGGNDRPFTGGRGVLRDPMRYMMYAIVASVVLCLFFTIAYSIGIKVPGNIPNEVRFSLLGMALLLLLWATLSLWLMKWKQAVFVLTYLVVGTLLAFCYAFDFEAIGYALVLTAVALFYHGLNRLAGRRLQSFGILSLSLDQIALAIVFAVPLISSPLLPAQLFARVYASSSLLLFETSWRTMAEFIAVGLGILLTLSITFYRAGFRKNPLNVDWCWLILPGGLLLEWEYSIVVLTLNIQPMWAFLGLTLLIIAGAALVRRFYSSPWANPLDVLALLSIIITLSLSLNQSQDIISALLLSFASLLYSVLIYQRRQYWLFLPFSFALLAIPTLLNRPLAMLLFGMLLPLASVVIHRFNFNRLNITQAQNPTIQSLVYLWEWPLLATGLVYGILASIHNVTDDLSAVQYTFGVHIPIAVEMALLAVAWYASSALTRMKLWLFPSVGFAIGALLIPTNSFWALLALTPALAVSGIVVSRLYGRDWSLPYYIVAVVSAVMTGYTGYTQDHLLATSWALLGFAAIAYIIGVIEHSEYPLWILPAFATWSVIISAGLLGDLYRPPLVALVCAALGVSVRFFRFEPIPFFGSLRRNRFLAYALPFYTTALAAAVLTGIYGTLAHINKPFYGAVPVALLVYALVAFMVLVFEKKPMWLWLVAAFAIWGTLLSLELTVYYVVGIGIVISLSGLFTGHVSKRFISKNSLSLQPLRQFTWSWPWYVTALIAVVMIGFWNSLPKEQPVSDFIGYGMLVFTIIALLIMLIERIPMLLVFPAGLAAWTLWLWEKPPLDLVPLMIAYSLLCLMIFTMQFIWRIIQPSSRWLAAVMPHVILGLGGQTIVVLSILGQGGFSANSGQLVHIGAAALLELALLIFWYGQLRTGIVARDNMSVEEEEERLKRLQRAMLVRHWCYYGAGLLVSLVISWELSAFGQTRLDILLLAPASYLLVAAPIIMRDEMLPGRHWAGQIIALCGAVLLLLPALWFSFSDSNLTPTLVLIAESIALLLLGISTRLRTFILSSAALLIVGTLRALFLSTPPSLALMVLGVILVVIATALFLIRNTLKIAWTQWE